MKFNKTSLTRLFFTLFSVIFLLFAVLQWDDPDSALWVSIYLLAVLMSAFIAWRRIYRPLVAVTAVLALLGAIYYSPASGILNWIQLESYYLDLSMKTIEMEQGRESMGLLIIFLIMTLGFFCLKNQNKKVTSATN